MLGTICNVAVLVVLVVVVWPDICEAVTLLFSVVTSSGRCLFCAILCFVLQTVVLCALVFKGIVGII